MGRVGLGTGTSSYCRKASYKKPIRKTSDYFTLEECEVLQIIRD